MESMIKENLITFKELEEKIFHSVCEIAQSITGAVLKSYDTHLMDNRDKSAYRHKGRRKTTIKTLFGEVEYERTLYLYTDENGIRRHVFLLDEMLELDDNVGMISENYAEKLVMGITTKSYRACAEEISGSTGQSISAMGVWNVIRSLGRAVCDEEKELVRKNKKGLLKGERTVPVIFEESDGVSIKLQGSDRRKSLKGQAEMKVAIAYDGWKETGKNRYSLDGKVAFAGFAKAREFHKIREAKIAAEYNIDEAGLRLLNGDGAGWIKKVPDKDTVFQLDPFHRNKAIREKIHDRKAQNDIFEILAESDIKGLFRYLEIYRDSLSEEAWIEDADSLIAYFSSNAHGLLPYTQRNMKIPDSPDGLTYRTMGTMEGHIWSIVAKRMKKNHTTWSKRGANNLAKILAKKCEGKLYEVTERLKKPLFEEEKAEEMIGEVLSAAQIPERVGHGYEYPWRGSAVSISDALRGDPKKLFWLAGY